MIFVDWFIPGYKAGGQIQSCANLAFALRNDLQIYVVTSDRDFGDQQCYDGLVADQWIQTKNGLALYYISPAALKYGTMVRLIQEVQPHSIYLNSMFSLPFTIWPLTALMLGKTRASYILAPRGMLQQGALQFKSTKKRLFLKMFSLLGVASKITFHATDETELKDIIVIFGKHVQIKLIGDYHVAKMTPFQPVEKKEGYLKCLFVSRISEKKNLLYLLERLSEIKACIELTIIGPVESATYWEQCEKAINRMPDNIKVEYKGAIPNHELGDYYRQHHLFSLLTFGENFGHVIFDAFVNGRPALISDQTPWKQLQQKKIGWEFSLNDKNKIVNAIEQAAAWDQELFNDYCRYAFAFAENFMQTSDLKQKYFLLFTAN